MNRVFAAVLIVLVLLPAAVGMDRAHFMELNKKGRELSKQQDWKGLREVLIEIGRELPGPTPTYLLRMVSVEAHLGNKAEALRWLQRYAAMGLNYDIAKDDDLKSLQDEEGFKKIAVEMKRRTGPIAKAEHVCDLPVPDLMPEDITFDSATGGFIVSSIRHHSLYRVTLPPKSEECNLQELPLEESAKRWPVLAVSADVKRKVLWMTASAMPGFTGFPKQDDGKAALFEVDAASGKVLRRFDAETSSPSLLGDTSVAEDGTVYLTDSIGGGVYRVQGKQVAAKLEKIADGLFSPQTPALASDGKRLFVADYPIGIAVIPLDKATAKIEYLPHPDNIAVTGLDGFYLLGNSLIGIQNGTNPERIMRFQMNPEQTEIISAEVIEQASDRLGEPTHALATNEWVYVSANVGWDKVDDNGELKKGERFSKPVLLRFRVK